MRHDYVCDVGRALSAEDPQDDSNDRVLSQSASCQLLLSGLDHEREVVLLDGQSFGVRVVLEELVLGVGDHDCFHVESAVAQVDDRIAGVQVEERRGASESLMICGLLRPHISVALAAR